MSAKEETKRHLSTGLYFDAQIDQIFDTFEGSKNPFFDSLILTEVSFLQASAVWFQVLAHAHGSFGHNLGCWQYS